MHLLLSTSRIRAIEQRYLAQWPIGTLMRRAAQAVADAVLALSRERPAGKPVVVLCGPGNNGADALLAGLLLNEQGFAVRALAVALADGHAGSPDRQRFLAQWHAPGAAQRGLSLLVPQTVGDVQLAQWLADAAVVVDGLFGLGQTRAPQGEALRLIAAANRSGSPIVAVDAPTGIDSDRGCVLDDRDGIAIRASITVTMIADKPGLRTGPGLEHAGRVVVSRLGLPDEAFLPDASSPQADDVRLLTRSTGEAFAPRAADTHKGSFGTLLIAGGGHGMAGAALLAAGGAQAGGVGKLAIVSPDEPVFDPGQPQWMTRPWDAVFADDGTTAAAACDALVIGCGLGTAPRCAQGLARALRLAQPLVIDADALTLLAHDPSLRQSLAARRAPTVLTPHPLEAARLLGLSASDVQRDRLGSARRLAADTGAIVVLKGAGSVIASGREQDRDASCAVVGAGSPALATAGSGDVLAGLTGALLAQRRPPLAAVHAAVWAHAHAGELAQVDLPFGAGLSAAELPIYIRAVVNGRSSPSGGHPAVDRVLIPNAVDS